MDKDMNRDKDLNINKTPHLETMWVLENKKTGDVAIYDSINNAKSTMNDKEYYKIGYIDYVIKEDFDYIRKEFNIIIGNYKNNSSSPISQYTAIEYMRYFSMGYQYLAKNRGYYPEASI